MKKQPLKENSLRKLLDRNLLRRIAGGLYFERGEEYFKSGQVTLLAESEQTLTARVLGTLEYDVKLWVDEGELESSCTCPVGRDGAFCKHSVASGLAWLEQDSSKAKTTRKGAGKPEKLAITIDDVRAYLSGQSKETLVDMLMEQAKKEDRFGRSLLLKTVNKNLKGLDLSTYRQEIDKAVDTGGFIDYRSAYGYARGIDETIDPIEALLKDGYSCEVIELTEYMLAAVEEALGQIDDSDGEMGSILERLQEIHLRACGEAKPDPEVLAKRLFEWEMRTEWDTFYEAAKIYGDILGKKGLAVYRELAEAEWARIPFLKPGQDDSGKYGKRFRITTIMETLARLTGDVEAMIAVRKRDLSFAYAYLQIAETYKQAGKHDLALEWAEQGLKAFSKRSDSRLRLFLADEYHDRKQHDKAMSLIWAEFTESPNLDQYKILKTHAERISQWPTWREKGLAFIHDETDRAKRDENKRSHWAWTGTTDHSSLVRIFLWEKEVEAAWREAKEGGCSDSLWMELAAKREEANPADALPVYQKQIEPVLNRKNNEAYREAVGLLRKVRGLMIRLGRETDFSPYLTSVRMAHKPKRNFMKLLDRAKW